MHNFFICCCYKVNGKSRLRTRSSDYELYVFLKIQRPKASGSRQGGPLATAEDSSVSHLAPGTWSWDPVPCNFSVAWPEKLRDLGLLSQMDVKFLYWQRLRDTQVNDESFTKQGPHHPKEQKGLKQFL